MWDFLFQAIDIQWDIHLMQAAFEPLHMGFPVEKPPPDPGHHLVNAITEDKTPVKDGDFSVCTVVYFSVEVDFSRVGWSI